MQSAFPSADCNVAAIAPPERTRWVTLSTRSERIDSVLIFDTSLEHPNQGDHGISGARSLNRRSAVRAFPLHVYLQRSCTLPTIRRRKSSAPLEVAVAQEKGQRNECDLRLCPWIEFSPPFLSLSNRDSQGMKPAGMPRNSVRLTRKDQVPSLDRQVGHIRNERNSRLQRVARMRYEILVPDSNRPGRAHDPSHYLGFEITRQPSHRAVGRPEPRHRTLTLLGGLHPR